MTTAQFSWFLNIAKEKLREPGLSCCNKSQKKGCPLVDSPLIFEALCAQSVAANSTLDLSNAVNCGDLSAKVMAAARMSIVAARR